MPYPFLSSESSAGMAAACASWSCFQFSVKPNPRAFISGPKISWKGSLASPSAGFQGPAKGISSQRNSGVFVSARLPKRLSKHYLVEKVSGSQLNELLDSDRQKSVVVGFYATWCGPCVILAQELEKLAVEFGHQVKFVKVDTDEEYELAHKMQVRGLPTIIFVSKDLEKDAIRTEGVLPRDVFRDIIQTNLL